MPNCEPLKELEHKINEIYVHQDTNIPKQKISVNDNRLEPITLKTYETASGQTKVEEFPEVVEAEDIGTLFRRLKHLPLYSRSA